jgi:pseudaminic acid synthase
MQISIGNKIIGDNNPVFIVAELSANHNGSIETAIKSVRAAKKAGADAIKLQTYLPESMTINTSRPEFTVKGTIWDGMSMYELYKQAHTPWEWHAEIFKVAKAEGLVCFSSPFDFAAVDLLEDLECPAYKIASYEITDLLLIEYAAKTMKPIIISTGAAMNEDIQAAIQTCRNVGNNEIIILQCTSAYPSKIEHSNLRMISDFRNQFEVITGLSDHSMGSFLPSLSVALGAKFIEKHFIIDRKIGGPDSTFSMNQREFKQMVTDVRNAESAVFALGFEQEIRKIKMEARLSCRSIYAVEDIKKGDFFSIKNIKSIRPGKGCHPKYYSQLLNQPATKDYIKGDPMNFEL